MTSLDNYLSSVPWGGKNAKKETENKEIMEANTMRVKQNGSELSHLDASNFEGTSNAAVEGTWMSVVRLGAS